MKKFNQCFLIFFILTLTGCGFHLRGVVANGIPSWLNNVIIIVHDAHADLKTRLTEQLRSYYVTVCPDVNRATYILTIERDDFKSNIASVSSNTTPRQYQVIYTVWFKLQTKDGKEIIPLNPVSVSRLATINDDRILGSAQEELQTKSAMREDIAIQIINSLNHHQTLF